MKDLSFVFLMDLGCHQPVITVNMEKDQIKHNMIYNIIGKKALTRFFRGLPLLRAGPWTTNGGFLQVPQLCPVSLQLLHVIFLPSLDTLFGFEGDSCADFILFFLGLPGIFLNPGTPIGSLPVFAQKISPFTGFILEA